ncbi:hypothetical protein IAT40_002759 [Kwoniella sp. CBS 6097]
MRPPSVSAATLGTGSGGNSGYVSSISVSGSGSRSGSSGNRRDTSSAHFSPIQSFPPINQPQGVIPATNNHQLVSNLESAPGSGSGSGSASASVSTPSTGGYPPSSFGNNNLIPSSFGHRKQPTSSNPITSAYSSPLAPPGPAVPSHVSSTELSSNRPLFSSTQGSANPGSAPRQGQDEWSRLPPVVRTYGKANLNSTPTPATRAPNRELAEQIVLSSSPISEPAVLSPAKRKSASPTKKRSQIIISDDDETEEEEYVEMRTPAAPAATTPQALPPKSRVQVVVPKSRPPSANKSRIDPTETPITNANAIRQSSPDPLDSLAPSLRTPAKTNAHASAGKGIGPPSSSARTESSRAGSVAPSLAGADGSSRRASSRQADNKAKAEQEKEERRRKRREEKERKKMEEEGKLSKEQVQDQGKGKANAQSPMKVTPAKRRGPAPPIIEEIQEVEESVIEIPPPPQSAVKSVRSNRKRKSDVAELNENDDGDGDGDFNPADEGKSKAKPKAAKKGKKVTPKKGKGKKDVAQAVEPEVEEAVSPQAEPEATKKPDDQDDQAMQDEDEAEKEPVAAPLKEPTPPPPPAKSISPVRPPLRATSSNISTPSASSAIHRPSPGPTKPDGSALAPGGIKWKAPRSDLSNVLAKFGGAKRSGISKRLKIVPLHQKIGPGVKALPPPPKKPEKKKAADDDDDDDEDNEDNWEEDADGNRVKKVKDGKKPMEWFMVED